MLDGVVEERQAVAIRIAERRELPDPLERLRRAIEAHALLLEVPPRVLDAIDLDDELSRTGILEEVDRRRVVADAESVATAASPVSCRCKPAQLIFGLAF